MSVHVGLNEARQKRLSCSIDGRSVLLDTGWRRCADRGYLAILHHDRGRLVDLLSVKDADVLEDGCGHDGKCW